MRWIHNSWFAEFRLDRAKLHVSRARVLMIAWMYYRKFGNYVVVSEDHESPKCMPIKTYCKAYYKNNIRKVE